MVIRGEVVHGEKIGGALGYPTANIAVGDDLSVANGVYAARVRIGQKSECYEAMANLGVKPTFSGDGARTLELHLFDFTGDLYGLELTVELVRFIRTERRFPSPSALRTQIAKDKSEIEKILTTI